MDLATAQAHLEAWLKVDLALTTGQSYSLPEGIAVQRVSPSYVKERINYWQSVVDAFGTTGGSRVTLATFR